MNRRTVLKGGIALAATSHTAVASGTVPATTLETLIAQHSAALALDNEAWELVRDITQNLEERGHPYPKVQTSVLLEGRDVDGNEIRTPQYSYSEREIEIVFQRHLHNQLAMWPGPKGQPFREKATASFNERMNEKLAIFRELQREYEQREQACGLTAAQLRANQTSDIVKAIEKQIIDAIPQSLAEAALKAAFLVRVYEEGDEAAVGYIAKEDLIEGLKAIGRAA